MTRMTLNPGRAGQAVRAPAALILAALLWLCLALPLAAQNDPAAPDFKTWDSFETRAEALIADQKTSNEQLTELRTALAEWRDKFIAAGNANADKITTVKDQLSALGPAPDGGTSEADEIARRRKDLSKQLAELQAPGLTAVEARTLAEARIAAIDKTLRERQASMLLTFGPSPLNPAQWPGALEAVTQGSVALTNETAARLHDGRFLQAMRANGPAVVLSLIAALLAVLRGRSWIERAANVLQRSALMHGRRRALSFVVSLGQVIVPVVGLFFLSKAVDLAQVTGPRGASLVSALLPAGFALFSAHWLGRRLFPRAPQDDSVVPMDGAQRRRARLMTTALGLLVGVNLLNQIVALPTIGLPISDPPKPASDGVAAVLSFPVILLTGLALFNLARILRRAGASIRQDHEPTLNRTRVMRPIMLAALLAAVLAPVLAALGYLNAAEALIWPAVLSLALTGTILLLKAFFGDLYASYRNEDEDARDGLIPLLMGFALTLLSLPVFALIWGVSQAQLSDLWLRFREGFSLGGVRLSPSAIVTFAAVFAIGYMATRLIQSSLRNTVLPKTRIDKGGQNAIVSGMGYVGIFLAALVAITSAGIDLSSLAIVAGALSVGIGFGLQTIVQNFVSGIILLIERPIAEGDWVEVAGQQGVVKSISVRSTRIETFDRTDVIVPNADFVSGQVINYTRGNSIGRLVLPVGVAYGSDTRRIHTILMEIAEAHPIVMITPAPAVLFIGFGASSLDFEIRVILSDVNQRMSVKSELNHQIAERFAKEGIEIPFPQQDLWLRNPETLHGLVPGGAAGPSPAAPDDRLVRDEASDQDAGDGSASDS